MGCNSEYMSQTTKERDLQNTAVLLLHVLQRLDRTPEPWQTEAARNSYCADERVVPALCALLAGLDSQTRDSLLYERTSIARKLADWWERHVAADRERNCRQIRQAMQERVMCNIAMTGLSNPESLPLIEAYVDHLIAHPEDPNPKDSLIESLKAKGASAKFGLSDFYMRVWLDATNPVHERIWPVLLSDIVGAYDSPESVPAIQWLIENASFRHRDNRSAGVMEFILNTANDISEMPEPLRGTCLFARASGIAYVLLHQGT